MLHEVHGEPIEQVGVQRLRGAATEVRDVRDQRLAEVAGPDVVHEHAGGERVLAVGEPVGEGEAAACARGRIRKLAVSFGLVRSLEGFERGAKRGVVSAGRGEGLLRGGQGGLGGLQLLLRVRLLLLLRLAAGSNGFQLGLRQVGFGLGELELRLGAGGDGERVGEVDWRGGLAAGGVCFPHGPDQRGAQLGGGEGEFSGLERGVGLLGRGDERGRGGLGGRRGGGGAGFYELHGGGQHVQLEGEEVGGGVVGDELKLAGGAARQLEGQRVLAVERDVQQRAAHTQRQLVNLAELHRAELGAAGRVGVLVGLAVGDLQLRSGRVRAEIDQRLTGVGRVEGEADGLIDAAAGGAELHGGLKVRRVVRAAAGGAAGGLHL